MTAAGATATAAGPTAAAAGASPSRSPNAKKMTAPPPTTPAPASTTTATTGDASLISLNTLLDIEDEITLLQQRKREVERNLAAIEVQLYNSEGTYLEQTSHMGNLSKGFGRYLSSNSSNASGRHSTGINMFAVSGSAQQQGGDPSSSSFGAPSIPESDRVFSQSSCGYRRSLQTVRELEYSSGTGGASGGGGIRVDLSSGTTPSSSSSSKKKSSSSSSSSTFAASSSKKKRPVMTSSSSAGHRDRTSAGHRSTTMTMAVDTAEDTTTDGMEEDAA